jgi:endonuclease/exonuclease/phosphatase family metal-dependent hydrolase
MYKLKLCFLVIMCISVDFAHSEKLPFTIVSKYKQIDENCIQQEKISKGIIKILSYNTWGLPIALSGHDQKRRFELLPKSILQNKADIIALQEAFNPTLRENLLSILPREYYTFSDYRCSRNILPYIEMDCYGGLMTLSAFPIVNEKFYTYPNNQSYSLIEKLGRKGFLVSQIRHGAQDILVINTHLYAGNDKHAEEIRLQQIKHLHATMSANTMYTEGKVMLVGDLNIQHPDIACSQVYDFLVGVMGFADSKPDIDENDFTMDSETNKYVTSKEPKAKLDYVFIKSKPEFPVKMLNQSKAMTTQATLSDHYGWEVFLKI